MSRLFKCTFLALALSLCVRLCPSVARAEPNDSLLGGLITALPEGEGTVFLGQRIIRPGDALTAEQLGQLVFSATKTGSPPALVRYLPLFSSGLGSECSLSLPRRSRDNQPPVAEDLSVETYKNLPREGLLPASDPEGQPLRFSITRSPRQGDLILREDGSFLYTPEKNKVGTDSFCYIVTDNQGTPSREATVTIRIQKPTDDLTYADTQQRPCAFEAQWLRFSGIFTGETINGRLCFSPEKALSRGEFLAMLLNTLELPIDRGEQENLAFAQETSWLRPYLSAAVSSGILPEGSGEADTFPLSQTISQDEAGIMICQALDFALPSALQDDGAISVWAQDLLSGQGLNLSIPQGDAPLTREQGAMVLYQLHCLETLSPKLKPVFG